MIPDSFPILSVFIPFLSFSFLNPSFLCSTTYFLQIFQKFLQFPLAVPIILRTFANVYKMIVIYPAGRPFRLWLLAAGFFYAQEYHFPGIGKKVYLYGGCMTRRFLISPLG